jgi:hypothetical protein
MMSAVTSTQSLLYAAESGVTLERIRALVAQVGPEALTVEYKTKMASTIARGIAALGNSYGGLMPGRGHRLFQHPREAAFHSRSTRISLAGHSQTAVK